MKIQPLPKILASCATLLLALVFMSAATAADLSASDGVFKVVKPPPKGARVMTLTTVNQATPRPRQRHRWFWKIASPRLVDADAGRLEEMSAKAAEKLGSEKATALVRMIEDTYEAEISAAARAADIPEALLTAVIAAESAGKIRARSHKGAQGLAQLMPGTAARFGVKNAYDPAENLRGAAAYLAFLLNMFEGDVLLALAGYNAGEHAVTRHKGVPPYNETRDYIPKVLNYYAATHKEECLFDTKLTNAPCVPLQFPD